MPVSKKCKKWASTIVGTNPGNMYAKFQKIWTKTDGGDRFLRKWANWAHFCPVSEPMGKNLKKWASTFVGTKPGNMCATFQKIRTKTEGGDRF